MGFWCIMVCLGIILCWWGLILMGNCWCFYFFCFIMEGILEDFFCWGICCLVVFILVFFIMEFSFYCFLVLECRRFWLDLEGCSREWFKDRGGLGIGCCSKGEFCRWILCWGVGRRWRRRGMRGKRESIMRRRGRRRSGSEGKGSWWGLGLGVWSLLIMVWGMCM